MELFTMLSKADPTGRGPLYLDRRAEAVYVQGVEVHLSPGEYRVLAAMLKDAHRLFTTAEIHEIYSGHPYPGRSRDQLLSNVRNLMHRLRARVHGSGAEFHAVWGRGWRLEVPQ